MGMPSPFRRGRRALPPMLIGRLSDSCLRRTHLRRPIRVCSYHREPAPVFLLLTNPEAVILAERIYTRGEGGSIEPLEEEPFSTEAEIQDLIADHPDLLDGGQISPGNPRRWVLVAAEKGIAETSGTGTRWSVDHLFVDQDAVPTLVEVKRGSSPEARRTVVGQMLEYAAHAARTWSAEELRDAFEETAGKRGLDPDEALGELLQADEEPDAERFWEAAAANLAASRLRLLFVSDAIPDSLKRVVEFLNAQMPGIEVLTVEIKQFLGKSPQTLVPRVLGRTAAPSRRSRAGRSPNLTRESFLDGFADSELREAAERLLDAAQQSGKIEWRPKSAIVCVECSRWPEPIKVARLYIPGAAGWQGSKGFSFGVSGVFKEEPGPEEELRAVLQDWVDSFRDSFTEYFSNDWVKAWNIEHEIATQNIDLLEDRLAEVLQKLRAL